MTLIKLDVMYGHLEGGDGKFARDPSGYLSIAAGIFRKHGLDVTWSHVQGTEERYRRLAQGSAQISLVVGRASLRHFLDSSDTRILGCAMNSCTYYLIAAPELQRLSDLRGKTIACRKAPAKNAPIMESLRDKGEIRIGEEPALTMPESDQEAYNLLIGGQVEAALLPRPYGFWAEARGFRKISEWPEIVDDPLPITIETTTELLRARGADLARFLKAHREGIRYMKAHRAETLRMLQEQFGHSVLFAAKTFDEYLICMNEALALDFQQFAKLLAQVAPERGGETRTLAAQWVVTEES